MEFQPVLAEGDLSGQQRFVPWRDYEIVHEFQSKQCCGRASIGAHGRGEISANVRSMSSSTGP